MAVLFIKLHNKDPGLWNYEIFSHYRTFSSQLGDKCVSKCSSDSIAHKKYVSSCVKKVSEPHLDVFWFSNPGEKVWKARNTMRQICPTVFSPFHDLLPAIGDQRCVAIYFWQFSTHGEIYFVRGKLHFCIFFLHLSFHDISVLVTFQLLLNFLFLWHFSFGDISVLIKTPYLDPSF